MTDLVERVARALMKKSVEGTSYDTAYVIEEGWPGWKPEARAAIAVVLEAMIERGGCLADCVTDFANERWL